MTTIDYFLIAGVAVAAIYTVYRLFLGWRNSASHSGESEKSVEPDGPTKTQPRRHVPTGPSWPPRAGGSGAHETVIFARNKSLTE